MEDGPIHLDTEDGKALGFTSDKFIHSWLWKVEDIIYISFIASKDEGKGNLIKLFQAILDAGYGIKIPTPSNRMLKITQKFGGFKLSKENTEDGECMYLTRPKE